MRSVNAPAAESLREERVRATEGRETLLCGHDARFVVVKKKNEKKMKQPKGNMADLYLHTLTESETTLQLWPRGP